MKHIEKGLEKLLGYGKAGTAFGIGSKTNPRQPPEGRGGLLQGN